MRGVEAERRRRAGPLRPLLLLVGNERPSHISPRGGPVLQELAGPCSHTQGLAVVVSSKFPHLSNGCTHCNRLIKPVGRLKCLEGPPGM